MNLDQNSTEEVATSNTSNNQTAVNSNTSSKISKDQKIALVVIMILFVAMIGVMSFVGFRQSSSLNKESQKDLILKILSRKYIGDLPSSDKMKQGELEGLVGSVGDKYTTYFSCEEYKKFQDDLNQNFEGIGVRFQQAEDYVFVDEIIPKSPASQTDLKKGDILVNIDGQSAEDLSFAKIIEKIRGKAGTTIKIDVDRPNKTTIDENTIYTRYGFDIIRQSIHVDAVTLEDKGDIAWIKVSTFSKEVDKQMDELSKKIRQNPNFKSIVLDLRDNGGGLLDQAVQLSSYFLEPGSVVVREKSKTKVSEQVSAQKPNNLIGYPLAVVINGSSASASEITAGALQDHKKAVVVGKTSYGKGVVQEINDLTGCDKLKVTIAEWLTPNGKTINDKGISPDVRVTRGQNFETKIKESLKNR